MTIQVLQFDQRVGLGTFSRWLREGGCDYSVWRADQQQLPPAGGEEPIILLGGYMGVNERDRLPYLQLAADWLAAEVETGRAILAICLGAQLLAYALGTRVDSRLRQEKGIQQVALTKDGLSDPLFAGLPDPFISFEWHNDSFELPANSIHLAQTEACAGQAFRYQNAWGVQFHPEVDGQIVADWCQRTGSGEQPLQVFCQQQDAYFRQAKKLLENFLAAAGCRN